MWKKQKENEIIFEVNEIKNKMVEEFGETLKQRFRDKLKSIKSYESALESLERKLKMKLSEMQNREKKIGIIK